MCKPPANIYFIPILAGTIKEPIKNYTSGSMHEPLFLPLRLLNDSDSINIGKNMKLFDDDVHPYFRISIADVGGHVITLEYYYDRFKDQLSKRTEEIKGTRSGKTRTALCNMDIGKSWLISNSDMVLIIHVLFLYLSQRPYWACRLKRWMWLKQRKKVMCIMKKGSLPMKILVL
ncbi:unnamed protein product [Rhizophagus irregularis]|nr:unnamed protein product [Rhizophagus irregularis]